MSDPLQPEAISWAVLLGRWMDFAKASTALPETREGDQWRDSVVPMITLQAVTFALSELEQVTPVERLLGWDRAEMLCDEALDTLDAIWGPGLPTTLVEVVEQAESAMSGVLDRFTLVLVSNQDHPFTVSPLKDIEPVDSFVAAASGTPIMPGAPIAWWSGVELDTVRGVDWPGSLQLLRCPVQVWRCRDEQDRYFEDVVTDLEAELDSGLPLLVPRILEGLPLGDPMPVAADVTAFHELHLQSACVPVRWDVSV